MTNPCQDLPKVLAVPGKDTIGISDSGLPVWQTELLQLFPDSKWILINRDGREAMESYRKYFSDRPYFSGPPDERDLSVQFSFLAVALYKLSRHLDQSRKMIVEFDDLNDESKCSEIWEWILPNIPFDSARWKLLNELTINPASSKVRATREEPCELVA